MIWRLLSIVLAAGAGWVVLELGAGSQVAYIVRSFVRVLT